VGFQALYRKYRPRNFGAVIGQRHVTQILRNSLKQGRVGHAYLFSGPRGTGKTSIARIYAKALNCPNLTDGDPCGACEVCTSIADGTAPDVIEIDAASNRGIDDVRELRERVQYAPARFKYKTYIIDEAHMITGPAFNALLKTLEEPPAHVVFILCTTEPHKLPLTILSRVLKFEFHLIPHQALAAHLLGLAQAEGYVLEEGAAQLLAELAGGCVRDAISLLDQAMVYSSGRLARSQVEELFYLTSPEHIVDLAVAVVRADKEAIAAAAAALIASGRDPEWLLVELASILEGFLLSRSRLREALDARRLAHVSPADAAFIRAVGECWEAGNRLRREGNPALLFRITLYRLADSFSDSSPQGAVGPVRNSIVTGIPELKPAERRPAGRGEAVRKTKAGLQEVPLQPEAAAAATGAAAIAPAPEEAAAESVVAAEELEPEELRPEPPPGAQPAPGAFAEVAGEPAGEDPGTASLFGQPPVGARARETGAHRAASGTRGGGRELPVVPAPAAPSASPEDPRWLSLLADLRGESLATFCLVYEGPQPLLAGRQLKLRYPHRLRYFAALLQDPLHRRMLSALVKRHYGEGVELMVETEAADDAAAQAVQQAALNIFPGSTPAELGE